MSKIKTQDVSNMFMINKDMVLDRSIFKKDFREYNPSSLATINNENIPCRINIPREDSYMNFSEAVLNLTIDVVKKADDTRYVDNDLITLVNNGGLFLFSQVLIKTSSKKSIESIEHFPIMATMYKMLSSQKEELSTYFSKDTTDDATSAGFISRRNRLINDVTDNKGYIYLQIPLKDMFGYCNTQDKITYGLGYEITLFRNHNDNVIYRTTADEAKISIIELSILVPHYTPSEPSQLFISDLMLKKEPINQYYVERSSYSKPVTTNSNFQFVLGVESSIEIPIYIIIGFQSAERSGPNQLQNNAIFDNLDIVQTSCKIGSVRYPDTPFILDYDRIDM